MDAVIDQETINAVLTYVILAGVTVAPYSTGIFETIVGVHFGTGLAVEFFDGAT